MSAAHLTQLRGTGPTIFFIDNEAAGAALVRGTSEDETARALVGCFWRVCIENNVTPWIERVCSKNNPADEPSRGPVDDSEICEDHQFSTPEFLENRDALIRYANWSRKE